MAASNNVCSVNGSEPIKRETVCNRVLDAGLMGLCFGVIMFAADLGLQRLIDVQK